MSKPEAMALLCLKNTNVSGLSEEGETRDEGQENIAMGLERWAWGLDLNLTATDSTESTLDLRAMLHNPLCSEAMGKVVTASCREKASRKGPCLDGKFPELQL